MSLRKTTRLYLASLLSVTTLWWSGAVYGADLLKFQACFDAATNAEKNGDIKLARERYEFARQNAKGNNLVEVLKRLAELSRRSLDKADEADALDDESYKEAKALEADAKSFDDEFKKLHQVSITDIDDLVRKCFRYNRFLEAEKLLRRKREMLEKSGQKTDELARTLRDLGEACLRQAAPYGVVVVPNKLDDAEGFLKEAIRVRGEYLGKEKHVLTVPDKALLAKVYILEKKFPEASSQLSEAEEIIGSDASPDVAKIHVELLLAKASLNNSLKQFKEAEAIYQKALSMFGAQPTEGGGTVSPPVVVSNSPVNREEFAKLAKAFDHKYAVVIGISRFADPDIKLNYASDDALEFANFLVNEANFEKLHVNLLRNEDATCESIKRALMGGIEQPSWLGSLTFPGDLVVIYISTHGMRLDKGGTMASYLIPHDYDKDAFDEDARKVIEFDRLIREVRAQIAQKAGNVKLVIFADACFSGGGASGAKDLPIAPELRAKDLDDGNHNVVFISSSAADEKSWELPAAVLPKSAQNSTKAGAGVFHYFLLDALRSNNDIASAFKQLQTSVEVNLRAIKGSFQTPQMQPGLWLGKTLSIRTKPTKERPEPQVNLEKIDPRSKLWRRNREFREPFYDDLGALNLPGFGRGAGK